MSVLESYHRLERVQLPLGHIFIKPGMRGYPDPPPAERVFRRAFGPSDAALVDATGTAGAVALAATTAASTDSAGPRDRSTVIEPSMAALRCARQALGEAAAVRAALPWDLPARSVQRLALAPPADRGNARVTAEMAAAAHALADEGTLYLALHKDQGAKRFQKALGAWFAEAEVVERDRGWRLIEARRPLPPAAFELPWLSFQAGGLSLETLPGVHAAGRLDPGTALLIETVPWRSLADTRVLDLGCGFGILGLKAAEQGGRVTAVDDDLAAVESARRNSARLELLLDVRHSDVDSELGDERFDVILSNPPFHVGRGVRLEVPAAFIAAAARLLRPGGELWLVANRDLPYERMLGGWRRAENVIQERGFKVLRARR